jgi:hypothetical protein
MEKIEEIMRQEILEDLDEGEKEYQQIRYKVSEYDNKKRTQ